MPHDDLTPPERETPTVVRHPWRATVRTTLVALVALLPLLPDIAAAAHIDTLPATVAVLAVAAAIQRVLAIPGVETWLRTWTRGLSAEPPTEDTAKHRKE